MNTARVRRGTIALLSGAALLVAPAVLLMTPASAAGATITVLSSKLYTDPFDGPVIVGELQNTGTGTSGLVSIDVTWFNSAGAQIGQPDLGITASTVEAIPADTSAATDNRSPFRARVTPPSDYTTYTLTPTASDPAALNHNFTVSVTGQTVDAGGFQHLTGTVTNNNTVAAEFVGIVATLYDVSGKADDQAVEGISSNASMAPGATGTFDVVSDGAGCTAPSGGTPATCQRRAFPSPYLMVAQSSTPGSAPSPSPSSAASPTASGSPNPTASGSPSASPSPSPTTVLPCRAGGGTYAIASTPSYKKIAKGGAVRLTAILSQAGRPCQAGLKLNVYVRGPGTTIYHLSRYGATVAGGRVTYDYSNVRADFRWYVVGSGAHSATNLVQAR